MKISAFLFFLIILTGRATNKICITYIDIFHLVTILLLWSIHAEKLLPIVPIIFS